MLEVERHRGAGQCTAVTRGQMTVLVGLGPPAEVTAPHRGLRWSKTDTEEPTMPEVVDSTASDRAPVEGANRVNGQRTEVAGDRSTSDLAVPRCRNSGRRIAASRRRTRHNLRTCQRRDRQRNRYRSSKENSAWRSTDAYHFSTSPTSPTGTPAGTGSSGSAITTTSGPAVTPSTPLSMSN